MKQSMLNFASFFEGIGTGSIIGIIIFLFIFILFLIYMSVVVESYLRAGSIRFGKYKIVVKDSKSKVETTYTVRSFGEVHAVEKVAKRIGNTESVMFKATRIAKL